MCEPFSLGAVFASIGSAFKFADVAVRIAEVGSENEVFVRTISVVRDDLQEVERLFSNAVIQRKIISVPGKLSWIRNAILNTKSALNEIGKWVERARSEHHATGEIRLETRVRWVFNDHEKLMNRKTELTTCHQQLSNVLNYLLRIEDIATIPEPTTEHVDTTYCDEILSRHRRSSASLKPPTMGLKSCISSPNLAEKSQLYRSGAPNHTSSSPYASNSGVEDLVDPDNAYPLDVQSSVIAHTHIDSIPCSPPPSYSSVVQTQNTNTPRIEKYHLPAPTVVQELSATLQHQSYNNPSNDSIHLSATNALGPVNPYELSAEPPRQQRNVPAILDMSFSKLTITPSPPAPDPSPPPGYPRRPLPKHAHTFSNASSDTRAYLFQDQNSISELPGNPIPQQHQRNASISSFSSSSFQTSSLNANASTNHAYSLHGAVVELPAHHVTTSHFSSPSPNPTLPNTSYPQYPQYPHSTQAPCINIASQNPVQRAELNAFSTLEIAAPSSYKPTGLAPSASVARMRRQKDMMELLGSLGE